jgi:hypothetical protein
VDGEVEHVPAELVGTEQELARRRPEPIARGRHRGLQLADEQVRGDREDDEDGEDHDAEQALGLAKEAADDRAAAEPPNAAGRLALERDGGHVRTRGSSAP